MLKNKQIPSIVLWLLFIQFTLGQEQRTIRGKIYYQEKVLSNVHVVNSRSRVSTKSDHQGNYEITAKTGDKLYYTYVGLKPITILVEDVTTVLNVKMTEDVNVLDDVVVKAKVYGDKLENIPIDEAVNMEFVNPFGKKFKPSSSSGAVHYLDNNDMKKLPAALSLPRVLSGRFSEVTIGWTADRQETVLLRGASAIIDLDGIFYKVPPPIIFSEVVQMFIMKKEALIIIRTKNSPNYLKRQQDRVAETYRNQNRFDANTVSSELDFSQNDLPINLGEEKEVYGKITFDDFPIADVTISIAGKKDVKIFSDQQGYYKLKAQVGDIIQFSHMSYEVVSIFIEDVTHELNIQLQQKVNELEEVVVESKSKGNVLMRHQKKMSEEFQTSRGKVNPNASGFSQSYIDGSKLSNAYLNIQEALVGKVSGYVYDRNSGNAYLRGVGMSITQDYPVAWEVDGIFTTSAPTLDLSQIKSIRTLKALGATNRYGSQAVGGVIIIETTFGNYNPNAVQKKSAFKEEFANANFYNNDATVATLEMKGKNKYAEALVTFKNKDKAFQYYQEVLKDQIKRYDDYLSVVMKFADHYNEKVMANQILDEIAIKNGNNPEALKAIAYHYQWLGNKRSAIKVYERLFKLRPEHAQSFRDLANAYADYDLYKKAWKLYYGFMLKGIVTSEEGIGQTMYNEMEWLYYQRSNQTQIKQKFVPISQTAKEFRRDIRMVFEWNTSEAEFELEFVSPDKRAYSFDHSLEANNSLIIDEKKIGYSSKMFEIENLGTGDWLINLIYKGNKKNLSSFFKLTTFYNWGKPNEKKVIKVYKLEIQNQKAALVRFNKEMEIAYR